jgi:AraC-like DNA-binding protein
MTDNIIPDRRQELADKSYRMEHYTWFRVRGKNTGLSSPHYLGRGVGLNPRYNIRSVWQAPMPEHVVIKFSLSQGGSVAASANQQLRLVKPGEAILRFVEEPDFWEGYHQHYRGKWEFLGFILTGDVAAQTARSLISAHGRLFNVGLDHPVLRRLLNLVLEPNHLTEMASADAFRLCNDVFGSLLDAAEANDPARTGAHIGVADAVESVMQKDPARDWSVDELAATQGISREHLTRVFSKRFGIPPRRYLAELRMQQACHRLRTTNEPIKAIVTSLGFQTHANFVRAFRRFNGVSPTEYRHQRSEK